MHARERQPIGDQAKAVGLQTTEVPPVVGEVMRQPGAGLDPDVRARFEARLGSDFSGVRVHTGKQAADSARAVQAQAYSVGQHLAFAGGRYRPDTSSGQRLLAHELVHVMRRPEAPGGRSPDRVSRPDGREEQLATSVADRVLGGDFIGLAGRVGPGVADRNVLHRVPAPPEHAGKVGVNDPGRVRIEAIPDFQADSLTTTKPVNVTFGDPAVVHLSWMLYDPYDQQKAGSFSTQIGSPDATTKPFPLEPWHFAGPDFGPGGRYLLRCVGLDARHQPIAYADREFNVYGSQLATGTGLAYPAEARVDPADKTISPVRAYFFPGQTAEVAMVIGGVHGSEPQGARVAEEVRAELAKAAAAGKRPRFATVVIPVLNERSHKQLAAGGLDLAAAPEARFRLLPRRGEPAQPKPPKLDKQNEGKNISKIEPNRTFPAPGETYQDVRDRVTAGKPELGYGGADKDRRQWWWESTSVMPPETRVLVSLVERFKPSRIVSVHAHGISEKNARAGDDPGIFVDPFKGREAEGDKLATEMIEKGKEKRKGLTAAAQSGRGDPCRGNIGPRPTRYSASVANVPGYSLGDWAPARSALREGAQTITVEIPQYETSRVKLDQDAKQAAKAMGAVEVMHKELILEVFLQVR